MTQNKIDEKDRRIKEAPDTKTEEAGIHPDVKNPKQDGPIPPAGEQPKDK